MRFLKRIAGFLGFAKEESHEVKDEEANDVNRVVFEETQAHHLPRKGFSVPVQVPVERAQVGPVLLPTNGGDGGVQVITSFFLLEFWNSEHVVIMLLS